MEAIEVENLCRIYRSVRGVIRRRNREVLALDGISFSVGEGELFGLLGPNGAGKTTTVKVLTTLLLPTSGRAHVLGYDVEKEPHKIRTRIGFIFGGERGLYWRLSGRDNLRYFADLYRLDHQVAKRRIPQLFEMMGLAEWADDKVETYSKGMKQRLHVARGLIHDPQVLFMDEPTLGLDPVGARELRQAICNLVAAGKTIFLTTHYMFEADALCHRIAVINQGRLVALDAPANLKRYVQGLSVLEMELYDGIHPDLTDRIQALPSVKAVSVQSHGHRQVLRIQSQNSLGLVQDVMRVLDGVRIGEVRVREPTLEDAYVHLVGKVEQ